jgi:hypothetical protein
MKKNNIITIEELLYFDKKNLTDWHILFKYHARQKLFVNVGLIVLGIALFIYPLIIFEYLYLTLMLIGNLFIIIGVLSFRKENLRILKKRYNKKYSLELKSKWNYQTIRKIRYLKLKKYLKKRKVKLTPNQIMFIINSFDSDKNNRRYSYYSIGISVSIIISLITILVGVFFRLAHNLDDITHLIRNFFPVVILFTIMIIYLELFVVKPFILKRQDKYKRLIKAFEMIYLEK